MKLKSFRKEIFRSRCDSEAQTLHCFAYLAEEDCSQISAQAKEKLNQYMAQYHFDF